MTADDQRSPRPSTPPRSRRTGMRIGKRTACSAPSAPTPSRSPSSTRRPTSPAACTSATRSTTRCRTWWSATSGCAARMRCGWSAPTTPASPRRWWSSASSRQRQDKRTNYTPRGFRRQGVGVEGRERRHDHRPAAPPRLLDGLEPRAVHHGPALHPRGGQGVRRPLQPGPDLPRQAAGELGPQAQDRDLRPRGRDAARSRAASGTSATRWRTA